MKSRLGKSQARIWTVYRDRIQSRLDQLTIEEPLEIRLISPAQQLAITIRTPGSDFDLVAEFLYSEGIIHQREDIQKISYCLSQDLNNEQKYNVVNVELKESLLVDIPSLERHFFTTSLKGGQG